jgi:hypothetical protein
MENNQNFNPEHIKTAGEKIQKSVKFIVIQVFLSVLFAFILSQSNPSSFFGMGFLFSIVILGLGIASLYNLSESGNYLIESVSNPVKSVSNLDEILNEEFGNLRIEKTYFSNGNLKGVESYNLEGKKHGVWGYYNEDGSLDYKEVYKDGNWVKNLRS